MKWFAIASLVKVFAGFLQEIKCRVVGGSTKPFHFFDIVRLGKEHNDPHTARPRNRQQPVEPQLSVLIHNPRGFDGVHGNSVPKQADKTNLYFLIRNATSCS